MSRKSSAERAGSVFLCSACGNESPKWFGRCPHCGEWNTAVEESRARPAAGAARRYAGPGEKPLRLDEIAGEGLEERWPTGIGELDRVLGGGLVPGSLVLIGGDPGIGKSTLALEMAAALGGSGRSVLYVSGEESPRQAKMRAERIALRRGLDHLWVQSEIELDAILGQVESLGPSLLVIDSIQTLHLGSLEGAPGSVTQVRECGLRLLRFAKERGLPVLLIGHVTKDGAVAGPRTLEHMVDAVLYLEGDARHGYRILSAAKNRFGSTNEIGVFEMRGDGLVEVANPSERLLRDRAAVAPGSVVVAAIEGTRPLLTEVQALVAPTHFANPQRVAQGVDGKRLAVLLAVLEKRARLSLSGCDVFVSVAGGIRLDEPAADLGVALALASSFRDAALPADWVAIGEVGLAGELRPVPQLDRRLSEAARLGFRTAVVPRSRVEEPRSKETPPIALAAAGSLSEAIDVALPKRPAEPRRPAAGPDRRAERPAGGKAGY